MAASEDPHQAPPLKKSIFNKPAWARAAPVSNSPEAEDSTDFFRRSDRTFAAITAEQEARRKKRKAKKEQNHSTRPSAREEEAKRRRTTDSIEEDEPIENVNGLDNRKGSRANARKDSRSSTRCSARLSSQSSPHESPPKHRSPHREQKLNSVAVGKTDLERTKVSNVISIDSDEESIQYLQKPSEADTVVAPSRNSRIDELELSDDEELFPELARKARDDAEQKRQQKVAPKVPSPTSALNGTGKSPTIADSTDTESAVRKNESVLNSERPLPPPPPDPIISIFVQSAIPDTIPFILNRKLNQRLREVRIYWCKRQNFPPGFSDNVILTWRGRRVFDVTSCAALGLAVNDAGKVTIKGEGNVFSDDEDEGGAQIHMEAMTEEMFEERQKRKNASQHAEDDVDEVDEVEEAIETEKEVQVRIILKSKDYKEFYLLVKPVSTASDSITTICQPVHSSSNSNSIIVHQSVSYH